MNLQVYYDKLYEDSIDKIRSDAYQVDEIIDSPNDQRFGLTLLLRPDHAVKEEIQKLLSKLKLVEPHQYYYPNTDLHVTVMSIISCYSGFNLSNIRVDEYIKIINKSLKGIYSFNIEFRGLTASPACLMVQGFLGDNALNQLRNNLRENFLNSGLEQSIDKRYAIQTAHTTVLRFKEKLNNKNAFLKAVEAHRNFEFGTTTINTLELVFNDWYQRKRNVQVLHQFDL